MPLPGGGKNAIAVPRSQEIIITSLYAIIVTLIFAAWWVVITVAIPRIIPRPLAEERTIAIHCHNILFKSQQGSGGSYQTLPGESKPDEHSSPGQSKFPWIDLTIAISILLAALGTLVGGITAGIILPSHFLIGHAAPANPDTLFLLNLHIFNDNSVLEDGRLLSQLRNQASRAIAVVDSGSLQRQFSKRVKFNATQSDPPSDRTQETSYNITYTITVTGYDMGLQHASDLTVTMNGTCNFMYAWVYNNESQDSNKTNIILWPNDDRYKPVPKRLPELKLRMPMAKIYVPQLRNETSTTGHVMPPDGSEYVIMPLVAGLESDKVSTDPWYFTTPVLDGDPIIDTRRPPLRCWEKQNWSYRGWQGGLQEVRENRVPNLQLSGGIRKVLGDYFETGFDTEGVMGYTPLAYLAVTLLPYLRLESTTKIEPELDELDADAASASEDMRRLAYGAYIMTKDLFRSTAINYGTWMAEAGDLSQNHSYNFLRAGDGQPLPGIGDFVIHTEDVVTLRLEDLVAVPVVSVVSWLLAVLCWWLLDQYYEETWRSWGMAKQLRNLFWPREPARPTREQFFFDSPKNKDRDALMEILEWADV
ncbi:hypothetical protein BDZ91DRAFT_761279 [Kalaharituber pfeilii]|nr:hypothetical protein BDZ91DRAFT_761279 [Kalaharituber pfeilii]